MWGGQSWRQAGPLAGFFSRSNKSARTPTRRHDCPPHIPNRILSVGEDFRIYGVPVFLAAGAGLGVQKSGSEAAMALVGKLMVGSNRKISVSVPVTMSDCSFRYFAAFSSPIACVIGIGGVGAGSSSLSDASALKIR